MASTGPFSKAWEDLQFSDNFIFCKVMQNTAICKEMLEILLNIKIDHVELIQQEKQIENYYESKGIRMDVFVKDCKRIFDIEMQVGNYEDIFLRARYYQGAMDIATTKRRTKYSELKESYIIFICKEDPFNANLPKYTKNITIKETNKVLYNDKTNIVFYNASGYRKEKDSDVRSVLQFIYNLKSDSDFTSKLAESVKEAKAKPEFLEEYMYFSDILEDEKDKVRKESSLKTKEEIILKMLENNFSEEQIKLATGASDEKIKELKAKLVCVK